MADKYIVSDIYPVVEKSLNDPKNISKYRRIIGEFIDKNHEILSDIGPTKMMYFTDYEKNQLYNLLGIDQKIIKQAKSKSRDIKSTGLNVADPYKFLMSMIIRYFSIQNNEQLTRMSVFYLGCSFYPTLFTKYWKFTPSRKVMEYTINNLSNKYKIKQFGNLMRTLEDISYGAYLLYKDMLITGNDKDIVQFILSLKTRLNSFFKQIANEWYKNYENGNYIDSEFESNDAENFREADSSIYTINRLVENISIKLIVNGPPVKLITLVANNNQVSVNELRNYIMSMIVNDNMNEIKTVIESILMLYLYDERNSSKEINSNKFLLYCLDTYKRSNTSNKNIITIKKVLDSWLERLDIYKKTQRIATINSFRRALYMFFVMSIQYYNN